MAMPNAAQSLTTAPELVIPTPNAAQSLTTAPELVIPTPNAAQSLTTAPELVIPTPNGGGICDTRCSEKGSALPRGKYVRVRSFLVERLSVGRVQTQHAAVAKKIPPPRSVSE